MGRKILLVDNNVSNREFIRDVLAITGLEVIEAENCQQGAEMAISQRPGLIMLAADIPWFNDSETFAVLRQFPSTRMIPVISVSSQEEENIPDSYVSTTRLLNQPVPIQDLVDKIRPYVNAARSMVN
ncbi:MAG: hypothetical protein A2W80_02710 [Candidatus Riflebacteria bacterium GWC2_50_8]|nr:MAG: hypothetical protein A2W80_02710 [Candidatus Riflebacteria bacterium GWC2_50_8]